MPEYPIPPSVMANAEKRMAAKIRATTRMCVYDSCVQAATHWPATGSPACETHRSRPKTPIPDPLMSEGYLRRTCGAMSTPARTSFDNRVEQLGQRVPAAKRAALRDDTHDVAS